MLFGSIRTERPKGLRFPRLAPAQCRACRPFAALPARLHAKGLLRRAQPPDGEARLPPPRNNRATGPSSLHRPPCAGRLAPSHFLIDPRAVARRRGLGLWRERGDLSTAIPVPCSALHRTRALAFAWRQGGVRLPPFLFVFPLRIRIRPSPSPSPTESPSPPTPHSPNDSRFQNVRPLLETIIYSEL
ncbi:hypothetical protein GY45DRAFT_1069782 [Cubamyces sp. BRFM 1775]|nr:hypothetical protein GY45DRAFT_1069782 [Cubamyces sp. BRFM 1775]